MRNRTVRVSPAYFMPGLLVLIVLVLFATIGLLILGILLVGLAVAAVTSAIYRILFAAKQPDQKTQEYMYHQSHRVRRIHNLPYTEYEELQSDNGRED